jgi:streptogramin lyase
MSAPLPEPSCRLIHLAVDPDGNVWSPLIGCSAHTIVFIPKTGEWQLDPADLYASARTTWQIANLPDVGPIQDEALDPNGRIWFVGDRGVAVYDPAKGK